MLFFYQHNIKKMWTALRSGKVIAIETDTVLGLAVDATLPQAVTLLNSIKQRDVNKPYVVMTNNLNRLSYKLIVNKLAHYLMKKHWPGALTLILPTQKDPGLYIGVRIPKHKMLFKLLSGYENPLFVTSANQNDKPILNSKQQIEKIFGDKVQCFLDATKIYAQKPSTILQVFNDSNFKIVRPGEITIKLN